MSSSCCVPGCKSNYKKGGNVNVFKFSSNVNRAVKWISSIPRENYTPPKQAVVCVHHFLSEDVIKEDFLPCADGSVIRMTRKRFKLSRNAIPCVFPNLQVHLTKTEKLPTRPCPAEEHRKYLEKESNAGNSVSDVPDKAESILPDVPNLAIVKKEPVDDTEDIHPSTSGISSLPGSSSFVPSTVKMEFTTSEDCMDDMTIPVNPDDVPPPVATTRAVKSYSMSLMCSDSREPSPKRPNLSRSPPISGAEIKDEFSIFGNYVADKIRSFTDRRLQVEAQHRITNLLFEMEMKGLNEDSLPVISKISSLPKSSPVKVELSSSLATGEISSSQKTLPTKVMQSSSSAMSKISSLPETLPTKVMQSSSSAISKISSLQTQISATVEVPSCSPIIIANLQTFPVISTLPSSSVLNTTSDLQSQFPTAVMLPSNMPISTVSSLKAQVPATVTSSSSLSICRVSSLQSQVPATETLPSSSPISTVTDLQEQKSTAVPSSKPINIASNLQTELPTTGILPSSSVIPFTSGNTIDLNTQVRPDVPKQT